MLWWPFAHFEEKKELEALIPKFANPHFIFTGNWKYKKYHITCSCLAMHSTLSKKLHAFYRSDQWVVLRSDGVAKGRMLIGGLCHPMSCLQTS